MSYLSELQKTIQGDFAELYEFTITGEKQRYTSYQKDVVFVGQTYYAAAIKRTSWANEGELRPISLKVTLPLNSFSRQFIANFPLPKVSLKVTRWFLSDPAAYFDIYIGELVSISISVAGAELSFESSSLLYSALIPEAVHQAYCNLNLFSDACGLDEFDYRVTVEGVTVSESQIIHSVFDTYAEGYFTHGRIKADDDTYRLITKHLGTTLWIQSAFPITSLATGGSCMVWPGCDKSRTTCADKFGNFENFLGFPFIPSHNPAIFGIEIEEMT